MSAATTVLKVLGLRDRVLAARIDRARARRLTAEAADSDAHSKPALHGMDVKLDTILDKDGGFFIEAGANDGFTQSNTYWLERFRGWHGLLVEPMQSCSICAASSVPTLRSSAPRSCPPAMTNRPCGCISGI